MAHYNLSRFDPSIPTPRTTRFNRRRRQGESESSDSSAEHERWRVNYPIVANILNTMHNVSSDSDDSSSSSLSTEDSSFQSSQGNGMLMDESASGNSSQENSPPPVAIDAVNNASSESTDNLEERPANLRDQLLDEQDDEYASEDDNALYEAIFDDPQLGANVPDDRLKDTLNEEDAQEVLNARVNVTKAEIFLAVLKFSLIYCLPQSGIADLFKMLNMFFATSVLPQSRYLIDKLFNFENDIDYYALCPNCKTFVTQFRREHDQNARCEPCNLEFSLSDPTYRDFFCIINPESEISHNLEQNWDYYESVVETRGSYENENGFNEFYSGLLYKQLRNSLPDEKKNRFVTATFNTDGSPVFESSAFSVWPIQIVINELPFKLRMSKPIVCGFWFGRNKPNMNMLFEPFVRQMNIFADIGITCNVGDTVHKVFVYAICSCVDSVARAPMQGVTQFNGYFGCNWCLHPGYYIAVGRGGSIKYILLDEPIDDRNADETIRDAERAVALGHSVNGVINESILSHLTHYDVVFGSVPDPLHFKDEGVGKQITGYWVDSKNMPYSLTAAEIDRIDEVLKALTVPSQLMRNSRSIRDRKFWKAKEWQNWILYYSLIILFMIPRMRPYAIHWSYFVRAYYILLQSNITREEIGEAHRLLTTFVALTELYYSRSAMTFNMHQLLHTAQSVINWGPLQYHSGYGFESGMGEIVKQIQAAKGVQYQFCRFIGINRSTRVLTKFLQENRPYSETLDYVHFLETRECAKVLKTNIGRYFGTFSRPPAEWSRNLNLSDSARVYQKLVIDECVYLSCNKIRLRSNNSFAKTSDNKFVQTVSFIVDQENRKEYTVCKRVEVRDMIENNNDFRHFQIKIITLINQELVVINTNILDKICVYMKSDNNNYICPVPNRCFY